MANKLKPYKRIIALRIPFNNIEIKDIIYCSIFKLDKNGECYKCYSKYCELRKGKITDKYRYIKI